VRETKDSSEPIVRGEEKSRLAWQEGEMSEPMRGGGWHWLLAERQRESGSGPGVNRPNPREVIRSRLRDSH